MKDTTALALLLIAGHLVADFVVQTAKVAEHKRRFWILLRHGAESYLVMTAVLWPFWSAKLMAGLAALVVLHLAVDAARVRLKPSVGVFLADQAAHLAVLAVFWRFLSPGGIPNLLPGWSLDPWFPWYVWAAFCGGLLGFNLRGGSSLVRRALGSNLPVQVRPQDQPARGAVIGYLERLLVMILVLAGQWGTIGLVMAAKSLARFKDLDERGFAEYYLIGTLTSMLVAVTSGMAAAWALGLCGLRF